jgi:hypothetical protein
MDTAAFVPKSKKMTEMRSTSGTTFPVSPSRKCAEHYCLIHTLAEAVRFAFFRLLWSRVLARSRIVWK